MRSLRYLTTLPAVLLALLLRAQAPTVDIALADNGAGQIEIRLRPDGNFGGLVSSLVFTVQWDASAGDALDTAVVLMPAGQAVPVVAETQTYQSNGHKYRIYTAEGFSPITSSGPAWQANHEYPICTMNVLVPGTQFSIAADAWTAANNADYYLSLAGLPHSGVAYHSAEPVTDIHGVSQGTGSLDVSVTPQGDFFGWVTDLTFTVRWPDNSGTHLGTPTQPTGVQPYLTLSKQGMETASGGFVYQTFHGAGSKSLANAASMWAGHQAQLLMSVPVTGTTDGMVVLNDTWTGANGGDYSIRLNSLHREGATDQLGTGIAPAETSAPALAAFIYNSALTVRYSTNGTADLELRLYNAAGQLVWNDRAPGLSGTYNGQISLASASKGLYILQARDHGHVESKSLVLD